MGTSIYFRTLCKNCYKMQMCNLNASIFDRNEERIKVHLRIRCPRSYEHLFT